MKYTELLTTDRQTAIVGSNEVPLPYLTGIYGNIQTWSEGRFTNVEFERNLYKTFMIFIDGVYDIKISDIIVASDSKRYIVQGVSKYETDYTNNMQLECILKI